MEEIMPSNVVPIPSKELQYQIAQVYSGIGNQEKMKYHMKDLKKAAEIMNPKYWMVGIGSLMLLMSVFGVMDGEQMAVDMWGADNVAEHDAEYEDCLLYTSPSPRD